MASRRYPTADNGWGFSGRCKFVIVLFTSFTGWPAGCYLPRLTSSGFRPLFFWGWLSGFFVGSCCPSCFERYTCGTASKVLLTFKSVLSIYVTLEDAIPGAIGFSGLLAVMSTGVMLQRGRSAVADRLSAKYSKLWVAAELLLFVLVGATVDIQYALASGLAAVALLFGVMGFRMLGVFVCLLGTKLQMRERLFCMLAYMPKATVQAAIGSIPSPWDSPAAILC